MARTPRDFRTQCWPVQESRKEKCYVLIRAVRGRRLELQREGERVETVETDSDLRQVTWFGGGRDVSRGLEDTLQPATSCWCQWHALIVCLLPFHHHSLLQAIIVAKAITSQSNLSSDTVGVCSSSVQPLMSNFLLDATRFGPPAISRLKRNDL
ncbi:hypothetical protein ARMGADRAFT_224327 [Armillaria gallica]|uniref:Uncharacterized protein n=1 Tax=Armillaria gallica TaxID=47427 RepID=A0A2H3E2L0_ARMGA|nr:hypothetical protein ARMGADRAFT_224327 [Armillaria gallica]